MTNVIQNNVYETFTAPFYCGIANIDKGWNGRSVQPIRQDVASHEDDFSCNDLLERIASVVVGVFLCIPLINILLFEALKYFETRFVVQAVVEPAPQQQVPVPEMRAAMREVLLQDLNRSHSVVQEHIEREAVASENIPEPDPFVADRARIMREVKVDGLRDFLPLLNFTDPNRRGYYAPNTIEDDGVVISENPEVLRQQIAQRINTVIERINTRANFSGVPNSEQHPEEHAKYYNNLEKLIKHIVTYLHQQEDMDVINSTIINLASMQTHCGGRYMGESHRLYRQLKNGGNDQENLTVEGKLLTKLTDCRVQILLKIIGEEHPGWMRSVMGPHTYNFYLQHLGKELGIPGSSAGDYDDPYGHYHMDDEKKARLVNRFKELYSPARNHAEAYEAFNCAENDYSGISRDIAIFWFKDNVPAPFAAEKRAQVIQEHAEELAEEGRVRDQAIAVRDEMLPRVNALPANQKALADELIDFQVDLEAAFGRVAPADKAALFNRYQIPEENRANDQLAKESLQRRIAMAMNMPQNNPLIAPLFRDFGLDNQALGQFRQDIKRLVTAQKTINKAAMAEHLTDAQILEQIQDRYLAERVLEDLGEGRGQRIRPEAVTDCLMKMNILRVRD